VNMQRKAPVAKHPNSIHARLHLRNSSAPPFSYHLLLAGANRRWQLDRVSIDTKANPPGSIHVMSSGRILHQRTRIAQPLSIYQMPAISERRARPKPPPRRALYQVVRSPPRPARPERLLNSGTVFLPRSLLAFTKCHSFTGSSALAFVLVAGLAAFSNNHLTVVPAKVRIRTRAAS